MIITRTPYRISLFGGGTDYPAFYEKHGGACLTTTIDKYCHILLRKMPPFLGSKYRLFWSKAETVDSIDDIQHPGIRGCLQYLRIEDGVEMNHAGDLPARSGLGSSSAFVVGMLHALHIMNGCKPSREQLAAQAINVEQNILKETVGIQDQIQCAWGGMNVIRIDKTGNYMVEPIPIDLGGQQWIEDHLLLVFTGLQRNASEIAKVQVDNIGKKEQELLAIKELVDIAMKTVKEADVEQLGRLLHETWMLKRGLTDKITTDQLDDVYDIARKHGAWGGKVLGAGGGGFFLFCAPPQVHIKIINALGLISTPVRFEHGGSQVVLET